MKILKKIGVAQVFLLAFVILFSSCTDNSILLEKNESTFSPEIQQLKASVQSSNSYAALQNTNKVFFNQLENHEIDLFGANNFIKNEVNGFSCNKLSVYDTGIRGFEEFANAKCQKLTFLGEINNMFPDLKELSTEELNYIFKSDGAIDSRATDCLDQFQAEWQAADATPYDPVLGSSTQDALHEYAVHHYDKCCEDGGDGCP